MDNSSTKSVSGTFSNGSSKLSLSARLKRLKIEENILLQSINKNIIVGTEDNDAVISNFQTISDFKLYVTKIKTMYSAAQQLFLDLKSGISTKQMLDSVDIDEIKKCTFDLESNLKALKSYLYKELSALKSDETRLNENVSTTTFIYHKYKRGARPRSIKYNEIVPSRVKALMESPFKCPEVQVFQDFMANSPNRYGGWSEYHHCIFVNYWKKFFGSNVQNLDDQTPIESSKEYLPFLQELMLKMHEMPEKEIVSHIDWYSKYIHLRNRQQRAIENWRSNKRVIKSAKETSNRNMKKTVKSEKKIKTALTKVDVTEPLQSNEDDSLSLQDKFILIDDQGPRSRFFRKCFAEQMRSDANVISIPKNVSNDQKILGFLKPTNQWNLRCSIEENMLKTKTELNHIETVEKL